ncbi:MAG: cytochrome c biogenesis protein CcsA [Sphingobacteriaceae bacterium]|nr:cytochrome c biogenesis protein CcsA [Sphingobacteriaceae bacterium]
MDTQFIGESLLPGKIGQFFIVLAFGASLLSTIAYFYSSCNQNESNSWKKIGRISFFVNLLSVLGIGITLFYLILNHKNEYYYVYFHSSKALPVYYIVSAFWEGQEGSFWLWAFWQSLLGIFLIWKAKEWENGVLAVVSLSQVFLTSMLLGVSIFGQRIGSSPFILLRDAMDLKQMAPVVFANAENFRNYLSFITDGKGLNPLLQNYWMVIHPPTLFLGFASMIVPFAYAITGLWQNKIKEWMKPAMPWVLFAVMILGTGIIMGSFWAYEALNFGGFWAWDPVENASLIPWLTLVAAIHVMIAYKNTGHAYFTATVLVIVSFLLVLYASFLTRSGILGETSVHSFTDLGMFGQLVLFNVTFLAISVVLIVIKWKKLPITDKDEETYSREFWMFIGALVITLSCIQILFSTSVPVFNKAFGTNFAPPLDAIGYYNKLQAPLAFIVLLISGFSQFLKYKRTDSRKFYSALIAVFVFSLLLSAGIVYITKIYANSMFMLLAFSCVFAVLSNIRILTQAFEGKIKLAGSAVAHIGFALLVLGALISAATNQPISINQTNYIPVKDFDKVEKPGQNILLYKNEPKKMGKYTVTYVSDTTVAPNTMYKINFKIIKEDGSIGENFNLEPYVQVNEKMGLIASPDTKHYITHDIYTHITSAAVKEESHEDHEGHSEDENYKAPRIVQVAAGDTLHVANGILTVGDLNTKPQAKDLSFASADFAVGLPLTLVANDKTYKSEPIFLIKGNNTFDFSRTIDELGLKFSFVKVLPAQKKIELHISEKPQQAKDWLVFKAIEFPFINLYWLGLIVMVVGLILSIFKRVKDLARK